MNKPRIDLPTVAHHAEATNGMHYSIRAGSTDILRLHRVHTTAAIRARWS
jgi:hypothetical protein